MKTNIRIIVQSEYDTAELFALKLEDVFKDIRNTHKELMDESIGISFMTTASDGRQTATIQFFTK